jgi:DNA-3-methyladenine glycosylase
VVFIPETACSQALPRQFYKRPCAFVALDLLGCLLCHHTPRGLISGRIVETEAYLGLIDPASHAFAGPTGRARIFWQGVGIAYIYLIYGVHLCFNVITSSGGDVGGVLVRALEPEQGVSLMKQNREIDDIGRLTDGPGKLTRALGITLADNGRDVTSGSLILARSRLPGRVTLTPRIGITRAREAPLRFVDSDSTFISGARAPGVLSGTKQEVRAFLRRTTLTL